MITTPPLTGLGSDIEFSVLITCHYEERSIDEFHRRLSATLENLNRSYEIVFVNDGSRDGTWEKLKAIFAEDPTPTAVTSASTLCLATELAPSTARSPSVTPGSRVAFVPRNDGLPTAHLPLIRDPGQACEKSPMVLSWPTLT